MIAAAAARSAARVRWRQADAPALPFGDGGFDRVLCQAGLMYFPDRQPAVPEMARVLRPGGRVVVLVSRDLGHSPGVAALADALRSAIGPDAAAVMRAPFVFGDNPEPVASLLRLAGFTDVSVAVSAGRVRFDSAAALVRSQCAGSPLAAPIDRHDDTLLAHLADIVAARLGAAAPDDPIEFPIEAHVACAAITS